MRSHSDPGWLFVLDAGRETDVGEEVNPRDESSQATQNLTYVLADHFKVKGQQSYSVGTLSVKEEAAPAESLRPPPVFSRFQSSKIPSCGTITVWRSGPDQKEGDHHVKEFLSHCERAVLEGDSDSASSLASEALQNKYNILTVIEEGFSVGVKAAGALWEEGEYFLPELAFSAEAMKAAMAILQPELLKEGGARSKGRVLMGTVQGDIHDIGKSLVTTMLLANNYEVVDLGANVPHSRFVEEVAARKPQFIGMSALLTTTMSGQSEVVRLLEENGLRAGVKVLVGGAPTSEEWSNEIGADGHGENAVAAVQLADSLLEK